MSFRKVLRFSAFLCPTPCHQSRVLIKLRLRKKADRQMPDDLNSCKQQDWRSRPISSLLHHSALTSAPQPPSPAMGPSTPLSPAASQLPEFGSLISSTLFLQPRWGCRHTTGCGKRAWGVAIQTQILTLFWLSCLPLDSVNIDGVPHSFSPGVPKGWPPWLLSHSYESFTPHLHIPLPSTVLVLPTVLCDSLGPHPTVLCLPLPVCFPLCPALFPGCRGPAELTGSEVFAFYFPGLFRSHLQFF